MKLNDIPDIPTLLRDVMAGVATPVSVITAMDGERPHGTTVSAFMSLSMSPPMVLIALDEKSDLLGLIRRSGRFGVNILSAAHADIALRFAKKGLDKFSDTPWTSDHDVPRIADAGWLACATTTIVPGGDHAVIMGLVIAGEPLVGQPLTYYARGFGTHASC